MSPTSTLNSIDINELSVEERAILLDELLKDVVRRYGEDTHLVVSRNDGTAMGYFLPATEMNKPPFFSVKLWNELQHRLETIDNSVPFDEDFINSLDLSSDLKST